MDGRQISLIYIVPILLCPWGFALIQNLMEFMATDQFKDDFVRSLLYHILLLQKFFGILPINMDNSAMY